MLNLQQFQGSAKVALCAAAIVVLAACGGGSDSPTTPATTPDTTQGTTATTPQSTGTAAVASDPAFMPGKALYRFSPFSNGSYVNMIYTLSVIDGAIYEKQGRSNGTGILNISLPSSKSVLNDSGLFTPPAIADATKDYPLANLIGDDGTALTTSFLNTQGIKDVYIQKTSYQRADVSGQLVKPYLYANMRNNGFSAVSSTAVNASTATFPAGSVIYIPGSTQITNAKFEILNSPSNVSYTSFSVVPNISDFTTISTIGGVEIRSKTNSSLGWALANGRVYQSQAIPTNLSSNPGYNTYFNKVAADAVVLVLAASCKGVIVNSSADGCS
jgi:hypothetical protein